MHPKLCGTHHQELVIPIIVRTVLLQTSGTTYYWAFHGMRTLNQIKYVTKEVKVDGDEHPTETLDTQKRVYIGNIGVKKFRSILRKRNANVEVFMVRNLHIQHRKPRK